MQYAFILGRVYTLSIAELILILKRYKIDFKVMAISPEAMVIETETQLNFEKLQAELGGVIKIVKIIDVVQKRERESINFGLQNYFRPSKLKKDYFKEYSGKKQFGVSVYLLDANIKALGEPRRLGMFIKKGLQEEGASLRAVLPDFNSLSLASVAVTKNLLLQKGAEIVVIAGNERIFVGKTLIVQDFEAYGRRDYQRPMRDEKLGMIPPKVAQIMINLANAPKGSVILDPFCGLGTILQEAILMDYKAVGSDISKFSIKGSETNLEWFRNRYKVPMGRYKVELSDVAHVSEAFKDEKIASVVTEGWLGPIYGQFPKQADIDKNFAEIEQIWTSALTEFKKMLPAGAKVVFCLPAYKKDSGYVSLPNLDFAAKLGYSIEDHFPEVIKNVSPFLRVTERNSMIYDRKDQIVAREIITLRINEVV
jgi:tRNA G10  N-methylase Trm11